MHSLRIARFFVLTALLSSARLGAQSVDTQSVTITYNGSSGATTATVHIANASNVTVRISANIDSNGNLVTSSVNTPGVFTENHDNAAVNIGTEPTVLGNLARRGANTYTGATLLISANGCNECIKVALTLQITTG